MLEYCPNCGSQRVEHSYGDRFSKCLACSHRWSYEPKPIITPEQRLQMMTVNGLLQVLGNELKVLSMVVREAPNACDCGQPKIICEASRLSGIAMTFQSIADQYTALCNSLLT